MIDHEELQRLHEALETSTHPEDVASARFRFKSWCLEHHGDILALLTERDALAAGNARLRILLAQVPKYLPMHRDGPSADLREYIRAALEEPKA